jgi:ABC-type branched-subunit amino acid transport system substrate-binding protein
VPTTPVTSEKLTPPEQGSAKVALLLPLSGPNADLGKAMLDAAQLALFTTGGERLSLLPRDTGGTPDGAAGAARAVIGEGATLILGPLLAAEVEAVKPVAAAARINVIAFSTATQLAGGNVFLMGFLPKQEAVREVGFARERGLQRFGALAANTAYGHVMTDALKEAVAAAGGTVTKIEYFDPRTPDTTSAVQHLLQIPAAGLGMAGAAAAGSVPFDALLLPEGGARLKQLAAQLRAAGVDSAQVRLLGSGLWDDPAITTDPNLYGGWFAASPPEMRRDFEGRFKAAYNHPPPRLASLAFDAAALAAVLAKGSDTDPFSADKILNPNGFTGVDGLFRFTQAGLVQRGLAVLEVGPQGITVVSPAPQSFAEAGL